MSPRFLMDVDFIASSVQIEVEAASLDEAWENRYELAAAADAVPQEWEMHPRSVETASEGERA